MAAVEPFAIQVSDRRPVIEAPTGLGIFPGEIVVLPRKWAEGYYNLKRWTQMTGGGHFAPAEEPEQIVEDIRAFFRPGARRCPK